MGYGSVVGSHRSHLLEVGTTTRSDVHPSEPQIQLQWQRAPIAAGDVPRRPETTCEGEQGLRRNWARGFFLT